MKRANLLLFLTYCDLLNRKRQASHFRLFYFLFFSFFPRRDSEKNGNWQAQESQDCFIYNFFFKQMFKTYFKHRIKLNMLSAIQNDNKEKQEFLKNLYIKIDFILSFNLQLRLYYRHQKFPTSLCLTCPLIFLMISSHQVLPLFTIDIIIVTKLFDLYHLLFSSCSN